MNRVDLRHGRHGFAPSIAVAELFVSSSRSRVKFISKWENEKAQLLNNAGMADRV